MSREKALKHIVSKCEKIHNLEYTIILEELESLVEILARLENDVFLLIIKIPLTCLYTN